MQQNGLLWHFPHKSRISPVLSLKEKILSRNWLCDFFDCSEAFPAIPVTPNPFDFSDFFPDLWNHKKISFSFSGVNVKYLYKHQCSGFPGVHQPKMWITQRITFTGHFLFRVHENNHQSVIDLILCGCRPERISPIVQKRLSPFYPPSTEICADPQKY